MVVLDRSPFFVLLQKLSLSPELSVFSLLLPHSPLSMGHSWSKHCVLHIILRQSPPAVSLWSRCNLWANFLIHLTGGCLTGSVFAKLMSSIFNNMYNSWSKHFFFLTRTYAPSHVKKLKPSFWLCIANDLSLTVVHILTYLWTGGI